jgi:hypothetical protein
VPGAEPLPRVPRVRTVSPSLARSVGRLFGLRNGPGFFALSSNVPPLELSLIERTTSSIVRNPLS